MEKLTIETKHCPKCGEILVPKVLPNEKPSYRVSLYGGWERTGDAFSKETGEKMYRIELDCKNTDKKLNLIWGSRQESHYGIYYKDDVPESSLKEAGLI